MCRTLNIFGKGTTPTPTKFSTSAPTPPTSGVVETRSSSGMISLSRVEMARPQAMAAQESRMMPEYPRGPEPFVRGRLIIEEETEYLALPPGIKSPGPKAQTRQDVMVLPDIASGTRTMQAFSQIPMQKMSSWVSQGSIQSQINKPVLAQVQPSLIASVPRFDTVQVPVLRQVPSQITKQVTAQDQARETAFVQRQVPRMPPAPEPISWGKPPSRVAPPAFPFGGGLGGGGGMRGGYTPRRSWRAENLIAAYPGYLARGLGSGFITSGRRKKTKGRKAHK